MSPERHDPSVPRISRADERERLLAEALAHAEAQDSQYRVIPAEEPVGGRWKVPAALALLAVAGVLALFPPAWIAGAAPSSIPDVEVERGLRAAAYLQAQQVEVFRFRNGRLPESLQEVPGSFPDLDLVKSNSRVFQIVASTPDGGSLVFDSAHPAPTFTAVWQELREGIR